MIDLAALVRTQRSRGSPRGTQERLERKLVIPTLLRFSTLDAMRGVAALTVLVMHIQVLYQVPYTPDHWNIAHGMLAVDMFFALSGFVLSFRYDAAFAGGMSLARFMRLRVIRLAPIYWLGAVVGAIPLLIDLRHGGHLTSALTVLVFNAALLPSPTLDSHPDPFPILSPAWSLFYEFWVANLLFAKLGQRLRSAMLCGLIVVGLAGLLADLAWYNSLDLGSLWRTFAGGLPRVIFSFFTGVAVQRAHAEQGPPRIPAWVILILLVASFAVRVPVQYDPVYQLGCVVLLNPILLYLGASAIERRPLLGKKLGDASYAVYVIHIPMMLLLWHFLPKLGVSPSYGLAAAFVVAVLISALAIDTVYDLPARRALGRALMPR